MTVSTIPHKDHAGVLRRHDAPDAVRMRPLPLGMARDIQDPHPLRDLVQCHGLLLTAMGRRGCPCSHTPSHRITLSRFLCLLPPGLTVFPGPLAIARHADVARQPQQVLPGALVVMDAWAERAEDIPACGRPAKA